MFNIMDQVGRLRRDITAEELATLPEAEKEIVPRYIAAALDAEEASDLVREKERALRQCYGNEDEIIRASQGADKPSHIDALKAVIAANRHKLGAAG
ncbi:hypothetical protein ABID58_000689 [Bradyrhizobium sp. S3.2.6]|uniref:hypothetical protein n=1 Tax=Bradyrhizobium sp. S3.2.6 TaxID=3156428 RepID=UPI0033934AB1